MGASSLEPPAEEAYTRIPEPPHGWERLRWLGPGVLWMVAAMGSGELLFTPRIAAQYGYHLLWAFLVAVALKWCINREVGRFAVCTGASVLDGFKTVPGPRNWAVWAIVLPQTGVAASAIAGFASSAATALILLFPGPLGLWTLVPLSLSTALVLWGRYSEVERVTKMFAVGLGLASLTAAISVFHSPGAFLAGLVPQLPTDVRYAEVLPWLGYALSGAVGLIWYSYWITEKRYGAAVEGPTTTPRNPGGFSEDARQRLRGWVRLMTWDTTVAVIGAVLITVAFLVLGAELLQPEALLPDEHAIARTLGRLLEPTWGPFGFWLMVGGVFVGFWGTLLSNQDGFARMFANGTRILLAPMGLQRHWLEELFLRRFFVLTWMALLPTLLFMLVGNPVALLKLSGSIEACHLPVVTLLVLYLNVRRLPQDLRPSRWTIVAMLLAALFFVAFAIFYLLQQVTGHDILA
jgi:Mn2+/Fe2+ NRAMP family transporter